MPITIATWNLSKRARAAARLPDLLAAHNIDILFAQEAGLITSAPDSYTMVHSPDLSPDTRILARPDFHLQLVQPSPLPRLGSYTTVATCTIDGLDYLVASVHALARPALASEIDGLDPDEVRRPSVKVPWVNDLAFHLLNPVVQGRRFMIGADLNTSRLFPHGPAFFDRAAEAHWMELVSLAHGGQVPTFLTGRSHRHQLDYLFTDAETASQTLGVVVDTSVTDRHGDRSSDHALVVASLQPAI